MVRSVIASALPIGGGIIALLLAPLWGALTPPLALASPLVLVGLTLAALIMTLHRPFDAPTPGAATVILPVAVLSVGPAAAAWIGAVAVLAAELLRRVLRRRAPAAVPERRHWARTFESSGSVALATLAGAMVGHLLSPAGVIGVAPAAVPLLAVGGVYIAVLATLSLLDKKLRRPLRRIPWLESLQPLLVDGAAWGVGMAVGMAVLSAGWWVGGGVLAGIALLALEAARYALRHAASEQRIDDLERLSRASRRMAGQEPGLAEIAERVRIECMNVVTFQWFQFEIFTGEGNEHSWWAGPDHLLREGVPAPPAKPPALPGIHRRSRWRVLERPLETDEQLIGRLRLWCDPRQMEADAGENLASLLPQMIASVQRFLLDREAKHDPLTQLSARRVLEQRLIQSFQRACEQGGTMAVIMCDLDFFKKVNDTHGHAAGDEALVSTAEVLLRCQEELEKRGHPVLAARYGGEEFTLLLEGYGGAEALEVAESLRREVEALEVQWEGAEIPLTQSLGVAAFPELHVKDPEELLELADVALYEAKKQGRNRALLHLGRGRFRTVQGEILRSVTAPETPVEAPQLFA